MKRAFISMTLIAASALGIAQPYADNVPSELKMTNIATMAKVYQGQPTYNVSNAANLPMKTVASGNYYACPKGAMFLGMNPQGEGFQATMICPAGLRECAFVNMNNDPTTTIWDINGQDASSMVDDSYNYIWYGLPGIYTGTNIGGFIAYVPRLTKGSDSYFLPNSYSFDDTQSYTTDIGSYENSVIFTPNEIAPLTYTETNMAAAFFGYANGIYGFGPGTTQYGTQDGGTSTATNYGVSQSFEKPMSPLYVENIYLQAVSKNGNAEPLKNGAKLNMKIYNSEDSTVIAELTAEMKDFYDLLNGKPQSMGSGWGQVYMWTVTFTKKSIHPVLGEISEPFVIDEPFTIEITGFDNPDIDCGFYIYQWRDENRIAPAYTMAIDQNTNRDMRLYNENQSLPVYFTALYDNVIVETNLKADDGTESDKCNVLRIENNGASSYLENMFDQSVYTQTATPWYNADGIENYTYEVIDASTGDDTEWITSCIVNTDYWNAEEQTYYNLINFTATECPEGEGRWAIVNINGRGVTSETPIILLQGTAKLEDVPSTGIENVVTGNTVKADPNAPVYNISGQRVSKDAKGILIQNGKKFMNK